MTAQPTPGPWTTFSQVERFQHRDEGDEETYEHWYIMKGATTIASMNSPCLLYKNAEADARLIAAAPRMLAFIRDIARMGDDGKCACDDSTCFVCEASRLLRVVEGTE